VRGAVMGLGVDRVRQIAMACSLLKAFAPQGAIPVRALWAHSLAVAMVAQKFSHEVGYPEPEQAYSAGMPEHYCGVGARAIIMEWNNPKTIHPEWKEEFRYYPQIAKGINGSKVPVIWNDSIAFQKFQRFAHADIDWEDIRGYLLKHEGEERRNFCLYGNDAEIFDFRPGRFRTEPQIRKSGEWVAIRQLYLHLMKEKDITLIFPSQVLDAQVKSQAFNLLALESPSQPIPVKKQPKYNVTRWAVTGRNSLYANTVCYDISRRLEWLSRGEHIPKFKVMSLAKKLCYLWSSDFRTNVTAERWEAFLRDIGDAKNEMERIAYSFGYDAGNTRMGIRNVKGLQGRINLPATYVSPSAIAHSLSSVSHFPGCSVEDGERFINIKTPSVEVCLNRKRGLAIHRLIFPQVSSEPLAGDPGEGTLRTI
jgi:hypothetical protein